MFMCIYPLLLGWMMMKTGIKYLKLIAFHTHISAPLSGQVWAIVSPIMTRHQHFSQVNNPALGENSNISLLQSSLEGPGYGEIGGCLVMMDRDDRPLSWNLFH